MPGFLTAAAPFLMAAALIVSAVLKLRGAARAGLGTHTPSLFELLAALVIPGLAVARVLPPAGVVWALVGGGLLLVGSGLHLVRRLAHRHRLREYTEGRRLETYLRYLTDHENGAP